MKLPDHFREPVHLALLLALATALAFAPDAYLPMLARAFLIQWTLFFVGLALVLGWRKRWWAATGAIIGALLLVVQITPGGTEAVIKDGGQGIRIMHMNVLQPNSQFTQVLEHVKNSGADVISIQEVGPEWAMALRKGLTADYPYVHMETRSNCYGIALFSKRPFVEVRTITMVDVPFIEAIIEVEGSPVRLLAVHATSPISYGHFQRRNQQFAELANYMEKCDTNTVLVGDLNTVPWDRAFRKFCATTELRPFSDGLQRTWPSFGPITLIPLDHLLVSERVMPTSLRTFSVAGSDHRGLIAELQITDAR